MKIIKEKSSYYLITDTEKMKIEAEVVQKYRLYDNLNTSNINLIYQENKYYFYYKLALKRLAKMQSEAMLKNYLIEKEASNQIVNQVIVSLKKYRYLDDYQYALNYTELKMHNWGPKKIQSQLIKNGVNQDIINEVSTRINERQILTNLISKEVTKIKSSIYDFKQKIIKKYFQKGFSLEIIKAVVEETFTDIDYDETKAVEKDYNKLLVRLNRKNLTPNDMKFQIRNKLLQKGYRLDDIKKMEEQ